METEEKKVPSKQKFFENKLLPVLTYIGAIGAGLMCVAYIICVFVLIRGFKIDDFLQITTFAVVNALVGFVIMQFLKVQGISFAKTLEVNKPIIKEYYESKTKDKKIRSIKFYWVTSVIKDVCIKAFTLIATTIGVIYIVVQGSNDYNLLWLAVVNLIMFVCFGFLAMSNAYDFFNNQHIAYMKEQLKLIKIDGDNKTDDSQEQCGVPQSDGTSIEEQAGHSIDNR